MPVKDSQILPRFD